MLPKIYFCFREWKIGTLKKLGIPLLAIQVVIFTRFIDISTDFNKDVFVSVVAVLDYTTLLSIPFVCKDWARWVNDEAMWKQISYYRYPSLKLMINDSFLSKKLL